MSLESSTFLVLAIVFFSSLIRSVFGFGAALVAMPLLALIIPIQSAAALVALHSAVMAFLIVAQDWRHIHLKNAGWLLFWAMLGVPLGLLLLKTVDAQLVKVLLAIVIISFAIFSLSNPKGWVLRTDRTGWAFGFSAGVLGGAYNVVGPPIVIYGTMRQWSAEHFRATLQGYFLPITVVIMGAHGLAGLWVQSVMWYFILSLPLVLVATVLGKAINRRVPEERFRHYVLALLLITGTALLIESMFD